MKALIIGGNRFFGRRLAALLLNEGCELTLLNRGSVEDGFGPQPLLKRVVCDRSNERALESALGDASFDVVVDQVCFEARDARAAVRIFKGRTPRYIFTSTISVYDDIAHADIREEEFEPRGRKSTDVTREHAYGEAKRQCETVFFEDAKFAVVAPRFPIICGPDDYTKRLKFHIDHIRSGQAMKIENPGARMSYTSSADAARVLKFLMTDSHTGAVNVSSRDAISVGEILHLIETAVGRKAIVAENGDPSPYSIKTDWFASVDRLQSWGFSPPRLSEWLPALIESEASMHRGVET